jgi:small basic protein
MWALVGLILGIVIGTQLPFQLPPDYSKYVSVAFLAGLDSVLGATRAAIEQKYDFSIFVSGFITNIVLAALLTFLGDRLGVDLYFAAIVTFGVRIFGSLAYIRRDLILGRKGAEKSSEPTA